MSDDATLTSVDNDEKFLTIANSHLANDKRLKLICSDGGEWVDQNRNQKYDYIFADTWHGKYLLLDEVLAMLNKGAFYIIDDMIPQTNWPDGHDEKAKKLVTHLESRDDLYLTKQVWATGIIVAVKK
jgi:predicted O-methyltransferase YrrM